MGAWMLHRGRRHDIEELGAKGRGAICREIESDGREQRKEYLALACLREEVLVRLVVWRAEGVDTKADETDHQSKDELFW